MRRLQINSAEALKHHIEAGRDFADVVLHSLDLVDVWPEVASRSCRDALLLGCTLPPGGTAKMVEAGAIVFPRLASIPFETYRKALYSPTELLGGYRMGEEDSYHQSTLDGRVYRHYVDNGRASPLCIRETLARRLHDHAITEVLDDHLIGKRVVAIMGGHAMQRGREDYRQVADIARRLSRRGFVMASGGGPGAMEATHLGAWFAERREALENDAMPVLARASHYAPIGPWLDRAFEVWNEFPAADRESVGIPTWLYGHEPPTIFATHIAKYFANCVREDGLLAIARHGVVFSPGSAGTIQEVFQDATQNHYETQGIVSPMVFLGRRFWTEERPVLPLLRGLSAGRHYADLIHVTDDVEEVVAILERHAERTKDIAGDAM